MWNPHGVVLQHDRHLLFVRRMHDSNTALESADDTGSPCFVPRFKAEVIRLFVKSYSALLFRVQL